jgi:hypothetical protein
MKQRRIVGVSPRSNPNYALMREADIEWGYSSLRGLPKPPQRSMRPNCPAECGWGIVDSQDKPKAAYCAFKKAVTWLY